MAIAVDTEPQVTGADLRAARARLRVTVTAVARHYGVHHSRISSLEAMERPSRRALDRYWAALERAVGER